MRGHSGEESRLTDMEMKSRGRYELFPRFLFVFTLQKKRMRPTKTFIIPGKIVHVFDIKRLKGESEREREWRGMCVWEWMVVKGGVAGHKEAEMRAGVKRTNSSDK